MGLLQKAVETYDAHRDLVGVEREGHQMLVPVSHILTKANLEITLEDNGDFAGARVVDDSEPKIPIPATEESAGRTCNACAHPLCDNLCYISDIDPDKHKLYVDQLTEWCNSEYSHLMLKPILTYVKNGTIISDLIQTGIIKLNTDGKMSNRVLSMLIRWRVLGINTPKDGCWQQPSLFKSFQDWYMSKLEESAKHADKAIPDKSKSKSALIKQLCMVTGEESIVAQQHPKGIVPFKQGGAKLISSNDYKNFTYRGRFTEPIQAATVGYIASQKAHNALRWLVAEQEVFNTGDGRGQKQNPKPDRDRVVLCWNPQGEKTCHAIGQFGDATKEHVKPSDYRKDLKDTLMGYKSKLPDDKDGVVIAVLDVINKGRIAVTYYNELRGSDYLERLYDWDNYCCWYDGFNRPIRSPSLYNIINYAFGKPVSGGELETEPKLLGQQIQRLMACRVDRAHMPFDIMRALVNRASTPQAYEGKDKKHLWLKILSTACAVINKYYHDHYKEDLKMELEPEKQDRSYQFGRLLAVFEKVERDTYSQGEEREPYAIRMLSIFNRRPMRIAKEIEMHLERAYFPRLESPGFRSYYKKMIGEILEEIAKYPQNQWDAPLKETYLVGYYLQRNELYKSKKSNNNGEESLS